MSKYINWQNTIDFIKKELGSEVNQIEIDEYKMQDIIETITMPVFCNYHNYTDRLKYPSEQLELDRSGPRPVLKIKNYDRQIYEIKKIYFDELYDSIYFTYSESPSSANVISNYIRKMSESMAAVRSWRFFRPDRIELILPLNFPDIGALWVEIGAAFKNPNEIEPTLYPAFRKLAAADVLDYIISLRTKYQQLTTPQGTINMDVSRLEQKAERYRSEALQELEQGYIPDYFWDIIQI